MQLTAEHSYGEIIEIIVKPALPIYINMSNKNNELSHNWSEE